MTANELRIGNFHKVDGMDIPREQTHSVMIGGTAFAAVTGYGIYLIEKGELEFNPIPLSEEWLLKFGFEKLGKYQIYNHKDDYQIELFGNGKWVFFIDSYTKSPSSREIKYVHQLQNLYFALTGEEL